MRTARFAIVCALGAAVCAAVGCGRDAALVRQAEATRARLLAAAELAQGDVTATRRSRIEWPAEGVRTSAGSGFGPTLFCILGA